MPKKEDQRVKALIDDFKAGRLGKGLKLKMRLGDDFSAVVKGACQVVTKPGKPSVVESRPEEKKQD